MSQHHTDGPADSPENRKPRSKAKIEPGRLPPYKLVLHADAANDVMFIVNTVMQLTRLCRAEATHKMWEAHHCGRSLLLTTHKERAELYAEQFAGKGLKVTLEPG